MKRFCRLFVILIVLSGWIPHVAAAQVVRMPDATLAAIVRAQLGLAPNAPITRQALQTLVALHADIHRKEISQLVDESGPIKDLTGLEHATQLSHLGLSSHDISDLGPLTGLTQLRTLTLNPNPINDFSPLAGLKHLSLLSVSGDGNQIGDLRPFANLTELRILYVNDSQVPDVTPLTGLTQLETLNLAANQIRDVTPLANLTQLTSLSLWRNQVSDVTPLANLTQLTSLGLLGNQVSDVTPLANLTQLTSLGLRHNQITDVTPLANLTQLTSLLGLGHNQITDVTSLANLTQLTFLDLTNNQITDVTPLANLTRLERLHLDRNQVSDVKPLAGLTQLKYLDLKHNQITDVTPIQHLIDSPSTQVLLEGNPIDAQSEDEAGLVVTIDEKPEDGTGLVVTAVKATHAGTNKEKRFASPGEKFALHVTVQNQGTEQSARTRLSGYRSTDREITTDDQQVGNPKDVVPLAPQKDVTRTLRVSAPKTAGIYYYGACVKDNNCSTKTATITVTQSDLKITSIKVAKKGTSPHTSKDWKDTLEVSPGEAFDLRLVVLNSGKRDAEKTNVKFYRSTDPEISQDDQELETQKDNRRLSPGKTHTHIVTFKIPEAGGTYYYGAKVEPVAHESDPNNNWSVGVRVGKEELDVPSDLISDIAFTQNATYFILNAQFPRIKNQQGITYGSCVMTLDLPGVPDEPLETWDATHEWLAGAPPYFMWELLSPRQQIAALQGTYDLDATEVVIEGIAAAAGIGVGLKVGPKVAQKVLPFIPLGPIAGQTGKLAPVVLKIGSKFKTLIPASKRALLSKEGVAALLSEEGVAKGTKYIISKVIGASAKFGTEVGGGYLICRVVKTVFTAGPEKEPTIEDELLAHTADPRLQLVSMSAQHTRPSDVSRYLFRVPGTVANIGITIEQVYFRKNAQGITAAFTAVYEGRRPLGNAGAPGLRAMSAADYPPFHHLPPEVQDYLRRDFGAFLSAETPQIPETTTLLPNYPNPFNPETWIPYQLAEPAEVSLTIYDIHGQVVRTLDFGHQRAGTYQGRSRAAYWDGKNTSGEPVASGVYFYTLKAGDFSATRKMLIRK